MFGADDVEYLPPGLGADANTLTPGFFSSPEDLLQAAQQTNAIAMALHNAIDANRKSKHVTVPKSVRDEWVPFITGWSDYFATNFSSRARVIAHWFTGNLQASLRNYQEQVSQWAARTKKYGVVVTGAVPQAATGGAAGVMMWIGIGVVVLTGLFIIGKVVHKATLGGAALEEAEQEAMRIADEKRRKKLDKTAFSIT